MYIPTPHVHVLPLLLLIASNPSQSGDKGILLIDAKINFKKFFFFFFPFRATLMVYGNTQARGQIGATAAAAPQPQQRRI